MNAAPLSVDELYKLQTAQTGPLIGVRTRRLENGILINFINGNEVSREEVRQPTNYKRVTIADLENTAEDVESDEERKNTVVPTTPTGTSVPVVATASSPPVSAAPAVFAKTPSRRRPSVVTVRRRPVTRSMGLTVVTRSQLKAKRGKPTGKF